MVLFTNDCDDDGKIFEGAYLKKYDSYEMLEDELLNKVQYEFSDFVIVGFQVGKFLDCWVKWDVTLKNELTEQVLEELKREAGELTVVDVGDQILEIEPKCLVYVPILKVGGGKGK